MRRHRFHHLSTAFLVVLSLLCSQLSLASYVCPGQADASAMAVTMASGEPCAGMDEAQPALCHEHAGASAQSVEAAKAPTPSLPMVVQVLQLPLVLDAADAASLPVASAPEARPPPDPLFLSTLRLRV